MYGYAYFYKPSLTHNVELNLFLPILFAPLLTITRFCVPTWWVNLLLSFA